MHDSIGASSALAALTFGLYSLTMTAGRLWGDRLVLRMGVGGLVRTGGSIAVLGIALAVAEYNGCDYCLSAHSYLGLHLARLEPAEIAANRAGGSLDAKAGAAVGFAIEVLRHRGHVGDAAIAAVRAAGYDDAQIVEIVQHVALNTWTNYINSVAQTVIDFPVVHARQAA